MTWLPGFERDGPGAGGSWAVDTGRARLVLHTTEGWNIDGALGVYRSQGVWPHFTVDVRPGGRLIQHLDTATSAMALYNGPDPMQTNRAGVTVQVEICGFAAETHTYDRAWYERLVSAVVAPILRAHGIPARCTRFYGQGDGVIASESWPGRMWGQAFYGYAGILGHQNVGDGNDHWDPGRLNAELLLGLLGGGTLVDPLTGTQRPIAPDASGGVKLEDDLTPEQAAQLKALTEQLPAVRDELHSCWQMLTRLVVTAVSDGGAGPDSLAARSLATIQSAARIEGWQSSILDAIRRLPAGTEVTAEVIAAGLRQYVRESAAAQQNAEPQATLAPPQ